MHTPIPEQLPAQTRRDRLPCPMQSRSSRPRTCWRRTWPRWRGASSSTSRSAGTSHAPARGCWCSTSTMCAIPLLLSNFYCLYGYYCYTAAAATATGTTTTTPTAAVAATAAAAELLLLLFTAAAAAATPYCCCYCCCCYCRCCSPVENAAALQLLLLLLLLPSPVSYVLCVWVKTTARPPRTPRLYYYCCCCAAAAATTTTATTTVTATATTRVDPPPFCAAPLQVSGSEAFEEDNWRRVPIGDFSFRWW